MTDAANEATAPAEEEAPADATIELRRMTDALDVKVYSDGNTANHAVHFAHWIGKNMAALTALAREDYDRAVLERKEAKKLLHVPEKKLLGPDGERLQ